MAQAATKSSRRSEMVRAAARLFSERGYHGTSMQHLADALGLLRGSLYAHIASKQELLFEVVDEGAERFLERGGRALAREAGAAERLREFLVGHVETAIEHLDAGTVFLNEWRYLSEGFRSVVASKRDRYEQMVRSILEDGIAEGAFREELDVAMGARLVLSGGNWIYAWYRLDGEHSPRQVGESYAEMLILGFARCSDRLDDREKDDKEGK